MIIHWHDWPDDLQATVAQLIEQSRYLLPAWLHRLHVAIDHQPNQDDSDSACSIGCIPEALEAKLIIYPPFFHSDDQYRRQFIRHEFIHALTANMVEWWEDTVRQNVKTLFSMLQREMTWHNETMVQSMAIADYTPKVEWSAPSEIRQAVEPLLKRWLHLTPRWVNVLKVGYDERGGESICWIHTHYDYRWATLWVCPRFLDRNAKERHEDIRHEICHLITVAMADWCDQVLKKAIRDDLARELLMAEWKTRVEQTTQDLAIALEADNAATQNSNRKPAAQSGIRRQSKKRKPH
jgi:hypothetical protein